MTTKYKLVAIDELNKILNDYPAHESLASRILVNKITELVKKASPAPESEPVAYIDTKMFNSPHLLVNGKVVNATEWVRSFEKSAYIYTHPPADKDAERYRYLRNRIKDDVFNNEGKKAGVWIDCTNEDGTLCLLTGDDADEAIDEAMKG